MLSAGMFAAPPPPPAGLPRAAPLAPRRPPLLRLLPPPPLARRLRREWRTRPGAPVGAHVDEREKGRARVAHLAGPRRLGQHLDADLERRGAGAVQRGLE